MKTKQQIQDSEFKQTELGEIPKDWDTVKIQDIVEFERGTEPGRGNYNDKAEGIRFLRVSDISGNRKNFIYTASKKIKLSSKNDVLIAFDGSPGIVKRGIEGAYSSGVRKVKLIKQDIDLEYIYYILQTSYVQDIIMEYSTGVTIKHASKSIPHIKIPLPSLPEQKSIAFVLSTVQEAKEKSERIINSLKEYKKSMMKHLFTYGVVPLDEIDKVELKETEIGKMPKGWDIKELRHVCKYVTDGKHGDCKNERNSAYYFISAKDIVDGKIIYSDAREITREDFIETDKRTKLEFGDILLTNSGTIGKIAVPRDDEKTNRTTFQKSVAIIKPDLDLIKTEFLAYYFVSENLRLNQISRGVAQKNLLLQDLRALKVSVPSLSEQLQISEVLSSIDEKIEAEEKKKEALEQLFKSLLHNLMSGKIRVNNLEVDA